MTQCSSIPVKCSFFTIECDCDIWLSSTCSAPLVRPPFPSDMQPFFIVFRCFWSPAFVDLTCFLILSIHWLAGIISSARPPRSRNALCRHDRTIIWMSCACRVKASNIRSIRSSSVKTIASSRMTGADAPPRASIRAKASRTSNAICSCVPPDRTSNSSSVPSRSRAAGSTSSASIRNAASGHSKRTSGSSSARIGST